VEVARLPIPLLELDEAETYIGSIM